MHHQRVRLHRGAPDAAAQLVQLREAEELRVLHDDRVDVGNVDPVLHDCGGHQHVRLAEREVDDPPLEVAQPAVRVREARLGHEAREEVHLALHVLDARHDVKDLGWGWRWGWGQYGGWG